MSGVKLYIVLVYMAHLSLKNASITKSFHVHLFALNRECCLKQWLNKLNCNKIEYNQTKKNPFF